MKVLNLWYGLPAHHNDNMYTKRLTVSYRVDLPWLPWQLLPQQHLPSLSISAS
jgi:hypothetical protein